MEFRGRDYDRRRPRSWDLSGESSSLHRTRSTGQSLAPNVHIYNYTRNDAPSPPPAPYRERLRRDDTRRHDFLSPGWENQRRQRSGSTGDPYFPSFERQQSYESFEEYQSHSEQLSNVRDVLQRCETLLAEVAAISQSKSKHEAPSSSTTVQIFDPSKSKALTFGMLAKTADDHIYRMRAWALEVQLDKSQSLAVDASDTASLVVENLRELEDLAYELRALCRRATPGDLIVEESDMSSTDVDDSSDSEYTSTRDQGPRKFVYVLILTLSLQLMTLIHAQRTNRCANS